MWPFKRKPAPPIELTFDRAARDREVLSILQAHWPIGSTFTYLDIWVCVTGHKISGTRPPHLALPGLAVDYVDRIGVIHQAAFTPQEARALAAAAGHHLAWPDLDQ